jgi:DNA-binding NarL/FixJ family response regulator
MTIRVLIADDQDIVRAGLTTILNSQPDIEVIGQAADGHEAVALALRLRPDVCLFDIRMPRLDGVEATRRLAGPGIDDPLAVVVIITFDTDEHVTGALRAGARGFLLKDAGPDMLVQAIHAAAEGDALIAPSITARLLASFADSPTSADRAQPLVALTDREEEVAVTVAQGQSRPDRHLGLRDQASAALTTPAHRPPTGSAGRVPTTVEDLAWLDCGANGFRVSSHRRWPRGDLRRAG